MIALFALTLLVVAPSDAAQPVYGNFIDRQSYLSALDAAVHEYKQANAEMAAQLQKALDAAEVIDRANLLVSGPGGHSMENAHDDLVTSQRGFVTYRDKTCAVISFARQQSSAESWYFTLCLADITKQRIQQLKSLWKP